VAPGFRWDIYVANADGTGERRLSEGGTINIATAWSADGRILFHSDRDGDFEVYSMRIDGSDVRQLTDDPADDTWPALAPDGRIAFSSDRDGDFAVWVAAADGARPARLTDDPADDWMPAWSPDGSTIAYLSGRDETVEIYAVPSVGGAARNLSRSPAMDELITAGAWSPDGSAIVYSASPSLSAATDPATTIVYATSGGEAALARMRRDDAIRSGAPVAVQRTAIAAE
jgi:TolB protein